MYYKALQERIEKIGTLNFPQTERQEVVWRTGHLSIPIFQDGTIYEKTDGGTARRAIVRQCRAGSSSAAHCAPCSAVRPLSADNMRSTDKDDVWEIITRFKFTREDALHS